MRSKILVILTILSIFSLPFSANAETLSKEVDDNQLGKETDEIPSEFKDLQFSEIEQKMDKYINQLEPYVKTHEDGTISLDSTYKQDLKIPKEVTDGIEEWMVYLNGLVEDDKASIDDDLDVTVSEEAEELILATQDNSLNASGRSGVDVHFWGYNIYLHSTETITLYQSLKTSGGAIDGLAIISRFILLPPTQLASAISAVIGGGLIGFGNMIQDEHHGDGVRIRFSGLGYAAVPTGVFPQ